MWSNFIPFECVGIGDNFITSGCASIRGKFITSEKTDTLGEEEEER